MKLSDKEFRPQLVNDIECIPLFNTGTSETYCLGSLSRDKYIQLDKKNVDAIKKIVKLMDGTKKICEIEKYMKENYYIKINVLDLCKWFSKAGLMEVAPEDIELEKQEMDYLSVTIKKVGLKKFYPIFEFFGVKYGKTIGLISLSVIIVGMIVGISQWKEFLQLSSYEINGSLGAGIIFMLLLFVLSIGIHEFSHAVVGYVCGLKPKELVFALYLGTPMFYIRMPGIYTITPKKRIKVWFAGIYANLIIASICMLIIPCLEGIVKNLVLICSTTNISLAIANLSPLLPLDGYFIMSTILKKPNLRKSSFQQFKKWFFHKENTFNGLYVLYFVASVSFYVMFVIYEVRWIVSIVNRGILSGYTWQNYVYEFRIIVLILSVIFIKKIIEFITRQIKRRESRV